MGIRDDLDRASCCCCYWVNLHPPQSQLCSVDGESWEHRRKKIVGNFLVLLWELSWSWPYSSGLNGP